MRKLLLLACCIIGLMAAGSCKKDNGKEREEEQVAGPDATPLKTEVATYEIVHLLVRGDFAEKYMASFGTAPVELLKTSDSTLTFYVPEVAAGETSLKIGTTSLKFQVAKTKDVDVAEVVTDLARQFDAQIAALQPSGPEETAEVKRIKEYKDEVVALYNSLSADLKRQAALLYEANREVFSSFSESTIAGFDGPAVFRRQSDCPRTDFKSFYDCTADNLSNTATQFNAASKEFITMLSLAGISAALAPASFGLSAFGTTLALGTAAVLLITETLPAFFRFRDAAFDFLGANWIFGKALFSTTIGMFKDYASTKLGLTPTFRSVNEGDADVNPGTGRFIGAMASLKVQWDKLTSVLGEFPLFRNTEEPATLGTNDISISNISNPNVEYLGNQGEALTFRSRSGKEESFNYQVKVTKQGFTEEKTLSGKVLPLEDSTDFFAAACVGTWTVRDAEGTMSYQLEVYANGTGMYTLSKIYVNWQIRKIAGKYYFFESGFWHQGFNEFRVTNTGMPNESLTHPVTGFIHYGQLPGNPVSSSLIYSKG